MLGRSFFILILAVMVGYWMWTPRKKTQSPSPSSEEAETVDAPTKTSNLKSSIAQNSKLEVATKPNATNDQKASDNSNLAPANMQRPDSPPPSASSFRPDYTAEEFREKFKDKEMSRWLAESKRFDLAGRTDLIVPNNIGSYIFKGAYGQKIRYRQAMGFFGDPKKSSDCASVLFPGGQPMVGTFPEETLEVRETGVKWTYIVIIMKQHHFLVHIDSTNWDQAIPGKEVIFYYLKDANGEFQQMGEKIGEESLPPPESTHQFCDFKA